MDIVLLFIPGFGGVRIFSILFVGFFAFVLCLVCPMLPVSLDCPFLVAPSVFSNVYLSCVPNVESVSGLSILDCPFGFL